MCFQKYLHFKTLAENCGLHFNELLGVCSANFAAHDQPIGRDLWLRHDRDLWLQCPEELGFRDEGEAERIHKVVDQLELDDVVDRGWLLRLYPRETGPPPPRLSGRATTPTSTRDTSQT